MAGIRRRGPFAWQTNNTTRYFEYPWVYHTISALPARPLTILELGGSLAGMQWVLAKDGHRVLNVDPGLSARGLGWSVDGSTHARLSQALNAPVELYPATIGAAGIEDSSVDVLLSISTIEHFAAADLEEFAIHARRILRPTGVAILTVDLFLNLAPFSDRQSNEFGTNIDIAKLLERSRLTLACGIREQLNGFPGFDPRGILARLEDYMLGVYPALAQCVVAVPS